MLLDVFALLVSKATFIGLRLVALYWCATIAGSAEFGALSLAFTAAEICRFIGDWGCDTLALRRFSHVDVDVARQQFWQLLPIRLLSSLVAWTLALVVISFLVSPAVPLHGLLISVTAVSSLWLNLGVNWLQARQRLRPAACLLAGFGVLCFVTLAAAFYRLGSVTGLLVTLVVFELAMVCGLMIMVSRQVPLIFKANWTQLREWLLQATPIALAALLALAYGRFDFFFIKTNASAQDLGDYALANRMVEPFVFVAAALASTLYARAATAAQGQLAGLQQMAWRWVKRVGLASVILGTLLLLLLPTVLRQQFPDYHQAPLFARLAAAALIFRCVNLCLTAFIQALGAYRQMLRLNLFNFALIALLVLLLGWQWAALGAAMAVVFGEMINTVRQGLVLRRLLLATYPST